MKHEEKPMADRMIQILNAILRKLSDPYNIHTIEDYCKKVKRQLEEEKIKYSP